MVTAAGIIIGDELLSGSTRDTNTELLVHHLRRSGVALRRLTIIGDDVEAIAQEVRACSDRFDWVITSGGLGPTHDDKTIEGIAKAFDREVVRDPGLEQQVRAHLGERANAAAMRFADIPAGARLLEPGPFPTIALANVFILPGVPHIFERKLKTICATFGGKPPTVRQLFLRAHESDIAAELAAVDAEFASVRIGSYPHIDEPDYDIVVVVESVAADQVDRAMQRLTEVLPAGVVVRLDK